MIFRIISGRRSQISDSSSPSLRTTWGSLTYVYSFRSHFLKLIFAVSHHRLTLKSSCSQSSGWYSVSRKQVIQRGGQGLFRYHSSLAEALQNCFPEFKWDPSKFNRTSPSRTIFSYYNSEAKQRQLLATLNHKFNIKEVRILRPRPNTA